MTLTLLFHSHQYSSVVGTLSWDMCVFVCVCGGGAGGLVCFDNLISYVGWKCAFLVGRAIQAKYDAS